MNGEILILVPLPVAGLMSEEPLQEVAQRIPELEAIIYDVLGAPRRFKVLPQMHFSAFPIYPTMDSLILA